MKRLLALLLAVVMCFSLVACGSGEKTVVTGFDGTPALNKKVVDEYIDRVELTVDNWKEYIKVYNYDIEVVEKDAFGEITNKENHTIFRIGYGTEQYHFLDAIIELQHKETGETIIYAAYGHSGRSFILGDSVDSSIDMNEYECTRIQGYLYLFNFPEDVFEEVLHIYDRTDWKGNAEIYVNSGSTQDTWRVDCDAKVIENRSRQWSYYFE